MNKRLLQQKNLPEFEPVPLTLAMLVQEGMRLVKEQQLVNNNRLGEEYMVSWLVVDEVMLGFHKHKGVFGVFEEVEVCVERVTEHSCSTCESLTYAAVVGAVLLCVSSATLLLPFPLSVCLPCSVVLRGVMLTRVAAVAAGATRAVEEGCLCWADTAAAR